MCQLSEEEFNNLRSQFVTSSWGLHRLNSPQAIAVNIEVMRAFVRLREMLTMPVSARN